MTSLLPPVWFVENFNIARARDGQPALGMLDPLVMMAWDLVSNPPAVKLNKLCLITGI